MKILIVSRGYPTKKYKMNGIFEFDQAKALAQMGHKVIYLAVDLRSFRRKRKWGFESFVKDGVQVEALNFPVGALPQVILNRFRVILFKILFNNVIKKHGKPEIIHAHFIINGFVVAKSFSTDNRNTPLVLTEHYSGINKENVNRDLMSMAKYTYPKMDKIISVSNYLSLEIKKKFNVDSIVIPNVVDIASYSDYINYNNKGTIKDFNFISVGRLVKDKGMDLLIDAFNEKFKGNKYVKLYIYGDGPEKNALNKKINEYYLNEQVFLMGLVERKDIAIRMSQGGCFVLASQLETFGVAFIEALLMGLPVISTKCGGPEDFINENNGLLIPVGNKEKLGNAMIDIYQNVNKYDKETISSEIKKQYTAKAIVNKLEKVYNEILKLKKCE